MTALDRIAAAGVVAVVTVDDPAAVEPLGAALVSGGLPCVEVTFRTTAAAQAIARLGPTPDVLVGAGTVVQAEQVDRAVDAGARFVVSPGFDLAVVDRCRALGVPVVPGVATATEAMAASRAGLEAVKLFPAGPLGGRSMVRALAGPFPRLRFMPTGGIREDDVADYLADPAVFAVAGSWIAEHALVRDGDFDEIQRRARRAVGLVARARGVRA